MKILQLSKKTPFPPLDGESVAISDITIQLLNNGHKVHLICMQTSKHFSDETSPFFEHKNFSCSIINVNTNINPILLVWYDFLTASPYIAKRYFDKKFLKEIEKVIQTFQPDIIHAESLYTSLYFKYLKKYSQPKIMRAQNIESNIWKLRSKNEKNILKKIYFHYLSKKLNTYELKIAHLADLIVSITEDDHNYFKKQIKNKAIITVPTGYQVKTIELNSTKEPNYIFFGALDWFPNIEALNWLIQKAWPEILTKNPSAQLHIAGRNPNKKDITQWKKAKNIKFYGQVENAEEFLKNGKIVLVPLFTGSGIRIKIIEAMALGLPVVATTIAAKGINVKNHYNILLADTEKEFAKQAIELHENIELYNKISNNAQLFISQQYNSKKHVNKLVIKYMELINLKNA